MILRVVTNMLKKYQTNVYRHLAQTLSDIEIILIDDESLTIVQKICDDYAAQYPNIKVIHKKMQGWVWLVTVA